MELVFFFKFTENHVPPESLPFLYFYSSSQGEWWNFYFLPVSPSPWGWPCIVGLQLNVPIPAHQGEVVHLVCMKPWALSDPSGSKVWFGLFANICLFLLQFRVVVGMTNLKQQMIVFGNQNRVKEFLFWRLFIFVSCHFYLFWTKLIMWMLFGVT